MPCSHVNWEKAEIDDMKQYNKLSEFKAKLLNYRVIKSVNSKWCDSSLPLQDPEINSGNDSTFNCLIKEKEVFRITLVKHLGKVKNASFKALQNPNDSEFETLNKILKC